MSELPPNTSDLSHSHPGYHIGSEEVSQVIRFLPEKSGSTASFI